MTSEAPGRNAAHHEVPVQTSAHQDYPVAPESHDQAIGRKVLARLARQAQANRAASQRLHAAIWAVLDAACGERLSAFQVREQLMGLPRVTLRTIQRHMRQRESS